jgi:ParB-like chromosome segregation protein Spo0J
MALDAMIRLGELSLGRSPRRDGICPEHVRALAGLGGAWPPIVVTRASRVIVDGAHRYHAARMLRFEELPCRYFDGTDEDAFLESVRLNIRQGLPLSLRDRQVAAVELLRTRARWSDRRIGEVCGLAHGAVARLRARATGENVQLDGERRIGRDGRRRPTSPQAARDAIVRAIEAHPGASSRKIAALVGSSPTTVASVRARLARQERSHDGAVPASETSTVPRPPGLVPRVVPAASRRTGWMPDVALRSTPEQGDFSEWFTRTWVGDDWGRFVEMPPLSRIYELADEARRRAQCWRDFAEAMERRAQTNHLMEQRGIAS